MKKGDIRKILIIIIAFVILVLLVINIFSYKYATSAWASKNFPFSWIFSTSVTLSTTLITPSNNTEMNNPVKFSWSKIYRANSYEIQVTLDTDPSFSNPRINKVIRDVSYTDELPLDAGSYIWRVRGRNKISIGPWSDIFYFNLIGPIITNKFSDNFSSYTLDCSPDLTTFGSWKINYNGYMADEKTLGCVKIESDGSNKWLHEEAYHASLVTSLSSFSTPINYQVNVSTIEKLRTEYYRVAWVLWNYIDDQHFYYFILKENGWELGKEEPAYPGNQSFLKTGSIPKLSLGRWYKFNITQDASNTIKIYVDDNLITTFTDTEHPYPTKAINNKTAIEKPYTYGKIGLYHESAHVHFDDVRIS